MINVIVDEVSGCFGEIPECECKQVFFDSFILPNIPVQEQNERND